MADQRAFLANQYDKLKSSGGRVDIYLKERDGDREIRIPCLPDKISMDMGETRFVEYNIMNRGDVAIPTGTGLTEIHWESFFPGKSRMDMANIRGRWQAPNLYHEILKSWMKNGTLINILVTGYPINMDVYLKEYSADPSGGFYDMDYEVTFVEARKLTISPAPPQTNTGVGAGDGTGDAVQAEPQAEPKRSVPETTAYTIKKGDCMWSIAQKFLGAGSRWQELYEVNKDIIDETAKKNGRKDSENGHWIYPGVTIQIPQ